MAAPRFADVRHNVLLHAAEHAFDAFGCVFTGCSSDVYQVRFDEALEILRHDPEDRPLTRQNLWDIATALLCDRHHRRWCIKDVVEQRWWDEFPSLNFSGRRSGSPLSSLYRPTTPHRPGNPSVRAVTAPTLPARLSERDALRFETGQVSPTPAARYRRSSDPTPPLRALQGNARLAGPSESPPTTPRDHDRGPDHLPSEGHHGHRGRSSTSRLALPMVDEEQTLELDPMDEADREMVPNLLIEEGPAPTTPLGYREGDVFQPTPSADKSPETIRDSVGRLLLRPITVLAGPRRYVYAIPHINQRLRYVKIGISSDPMRRVEELWTTHRRHHIDRGRMWPFPAAVPFAEARRLELLVHKDLAYHRRTLHQMGEQHTEWFEIDMTTAQETIQLWWEIMIRHNLRPETALSQEFRTALDVSTFIPGVVGQSNNQDDWVRVHEDHEGRIDWWTKLLLDPFPGPDEIQPPATQGLLEADGMDQSHDTHTGHTPRSANIQVQESMDIPPRDNSNLKQYMIFLLLFGLWWSIPWLINTPQLIARIIQGLLASVCVRWPKTMP